MSKNQKRKGLERHRDSYKRNELAIDAHFRNSAGPMRTKKKDKKLERQESRNFERFFNKFDEV